MHFKYTMKTEKVLNMYKKYFNFLMYTILTQREKICSCTVCKESAILACYVQKILVMYKTEALKNT